MKAGGCDTCCQGKEEGKEAKGKGKEGEGFSKAMMSSEG